MNEEDQVDEYQIEDIPELESVKDPSELPIVFTILPEVIKLPHDVDGSQMLLLSFAEEEVKEFSDIFTTMLTDGETNANLLTLALYERFGAKALLYLSCLGIQDLADRFIQFQAEEPIVGDQHVN